MVIRVHEAKNPWIVGLSLGSTTDNSAAQVANPVAQLTAGNWILADNANGRVVMLPESSGSFAVLPISSSSTGSITYTVWRVHRGSGKSGYAAPYTLEGNPVGFCENACRDTGSVVAFTDTVIGTSASQIITVAPRPPLVDYSAGGTTIFPADIRKFSSNGAFAVVISCLARTNASGVLIKVF